VGAFEDRIQLMRLVFGGMAAQVVGLVAQWRLADVLGDDTRTAADLAAELGNPEHTTVRVLRAAASLGLLDEPEAGRFALTPVGALLRTDHPASAFATTRMFTDPVMTGAWQKLPDAAQTGRTTFADVFGTDFFDHLKGEPELSALFNAAMGQGTAGVAAVLPQHYDFGRFGTIMDVGGGDGTLLSAILREHPGVRGVLYDTVEGSAQASATFRTAGVADRVTVQTGDFFADVPGGAELYLLKSIVHDWSDDQVTTILRHCRKVIPRDGRLLVLEPVLPDAVDHSLPPFAYLSDLNMMVNVGGRERTRADFEQVCTRAGFTVTAVTPLPPPIMFSIIEAIPA
jgi:hypothetical protein